MNPMETASRIVSSEAEELILVDGDDNEIGSLSKAAAHDGDGVLHRAFSVFLFNPNGKLLLQQRAQGKRLWPGYWSNSCCSHPRRGESMEVATSRRLRDELNLDAELEYVYRFSYQARYSELGSEHELCHVYLGRIDGFVDFNRNEIEATRFISPAALDEEFEQKPETLTPWFRMEWQALRTDYSEQLAGYLSRR